MIDFDEIIDSLRFYRRVVFFVLGLVALGLLLWLFCPRGGNPEVKAKIDEIKTTTETNERRADEIIDAAKSREESAIRETAENIGAVSDDYLPDVLAGLLAEYRRERGGR